MMYYKTGDVCQKIINVDGFDFQFETNEHIALEIVVSRYHEGNSIDGILVFRRRSIHSVRYFETKYL